MDARIVTVALGVLGLGAARWERAPVPVDPRVLDRGGVWVEARELVPAPPVALDDGAVVRWDVPEPPCVAPASEAAPRLSLNLATQAELEGLPGIGPALARRIVADRPYRQVADLDRVKGIGPATLARLRPLVRP